MLPSNIALWQQLSLMPNIFAVVRYFQSWCTWFLCKKWINYFELAHKFKAQLGNRKHNIYLFWPNSYGVWKGPFVLASLWRCLTGLSLREWLCKVYLEMYSMIKEHLVYWIMAAIHHFIIITFFFLLNHFYKYSI